MDIKILPIVECFQPKDKSVVGSRVLMPKADFLGLLADKIKDVDWDKCGGKAFVLFDSAKEAKVLEQVMPGDGPLKGRKEEDFVIRLRRRDWNVYLGRDHAFEDTTFLAAVVYNAEAMRADPDLKIEPEVMKGITIEDDAYYLIVVIAAGGDSGMSVHRTALNYAGGNTDNDIHLQVEKKMDAWRRAEGVKPDGKAVFGDSKQGFKQMMTFYVEEVNKLRQALTTARDKGREFMVVAD